MQGRQRSPVRHSEGVESGGDARMRAIAQLALAVETGGDVEEAVRAAYHAGAEAYQIAELGGVSIRRVLEVLGRPQP